MPNHLDNELYRHCVCRMGAAVMGRPVEQLQFHTFDHGGPDDLFRVTGQELHGSATASRP